MPKLSYSRRDSVTPPPVEVRPSQAHSLAKLLYFSYIQPTIQLWGYSSVGRATGSQSVGHGFDSHYLHVKEASFRLPLLFSIYTKFLIKLSCLPPTSYCLLWQRRLNIPFHAELELREHSAFAIKALVEIRQIHVFVVAFQP